MSSGVICSASASGMIDCGTTLIALMSLRLTRRGDARALPERDARRRLLADDADQRVAGRALHRIRLVVLRDRAVRLEDVGEQHRHRLVTHRGEVRADLDAALAVHLVAHRTVLACTRPRPARRRRVRRAPPHSAPCVPRGPLALPRAPCGRARGCASSRCMIRLRVCPKLSIHRLTVPCCSASSMAMRPFATREDHGGRRGAHVGRQRRPLRQQERRRAVRQECVPAP